MADDPRMTRATAQPEGQADPFTDPTKRGIFRDHRCWKCNDGEKPCVQKRPGLCEYPHSRND